jgi:hypothetical protein
LTETTEEIESAACHAVSGFASIEGAKRRVIIRRARYMVLDRIHAGERDPIKIHASVMDSLQADRVTGPLLTIVLFAVVSAAVEWLVKYLLDKLRNEEPDDA